ncbi:type II CAAX prenyl endopeptidase Rce1 family protein [Streptomyces sp. NPDC008001]|uniref:CPBP family glutamic-type intramembrane protease n=1 Tax=Streptomyces sp. NPDC008001 TaxID=3364804 RepID=UPI0036E2D78F
MTAHWPWAARLALAAAFVPLYYWWCKRLLFAAARRWAHRFTKDRRYDRSEIGGVVELSAAAVSHVLAVTVLLWLTGLSLSAVRLDALDPVLLLLGVLVGVGEMGIASFLCRLVIEASLHRPGRRAARATAGGGAASGPAAASAAAPAGPARLTGPRDVGGWIAMSRGGWLRHHFKTVEVLPLPLAVTVMAVQVGCEETVFRGVLFGYLGSAGLPATLAVSVVLFVLMQCFFMGSWRAAMFPMVGALVMGVAHGLLFWSVPALPPLIVAHVTFFLFAVL